ncbi:hypothetical protein C2G38_2200003 [Gigaspora rosea]|uniref:Uncharacterized protein n=1 Tax=Gigaspora rosea TaxID=44941 RepID=A0A397UVC3_9GLOM|nr:hypothetical protein C2G38_2200003 [Gigaspora rosea]
MKASYTDLSGDSESNANYVTKLVSFLTIELDKIENFWNISHTQSEKYYDEHTMVAPLIAENTT